MRLISLPTNWSTLVYSETMYCRGIWEKWLLLPRTRSNTATSHTLRFSCSVCVCFSLDVWCHVPATTTRFLCVLFSHFYYDFLLKIPSKNIRQHHYLHVFLFFSVIGLPHHLPNHEKPRDFLIRFSTVSCYILSYHFLRFSFFSLALSFILLPCKSKECISLFELHCRH